MSGETHEQNEIWVVESRTEGGDKWSVDEFCDLEEQARRVMSRHDDDDVCSHMLPVEYRVRRFVAAEHGVIRLPAEGLSMKGWTE